MPTVITNCSNNFGAFQYPEKLIPKTIINGILGKPIPIYGNGQQIRDWLFVDDHAEALVIAAFNAKAGTTYNIGANQEKQNIQLVETICCILDELVIEKPGGIETHKDLITYVDDRPGHDLRYAIDAQKFANDFGWKPKNNFYTALRDTIKWYLNNKHWWQCILN